MTYRDFKNELIQKSVIEIKDFVHAEFYNSNTVINVNRCLIYPEAGVFLYNGDILVLFMEGNVEKIELIDMRNSQFYHMKIKKGTDDVSVYLSLDSHSILDRKPLVKTEVGDIVILQENNAPYGLTMFYAKHKTEFFKQRDTIIQDLGWVVNKVIEDKVFEIEKDEKVKFVSISNAFNLKEIEINGEELMKRIQD